MPEIEETNQIGTEVANPEPAPVTNPDKGSAPEAGGEPNADAIVESPLTPEQLAEIKERAEKYASLEPEYRRTTQLLTDLQRRNEQQQQAIQALSGQVSAATDPIEAARQEWLEAKTVTFDAEAEIRAFEKYQNLLAQRQTNEIAQKVIQATRVQSQLGTAAQMLGLSDENAALQRLNTVQQTLSPQDLAVVEMFRSGKLPEYLSRQQKEAEAKAESAKLAASGMSGRAMGATPSTDNADPHPPPMIFFAWSNSQQRKHVEKHGLPPYAAEAE